jgi:uncharacterized protein (TIGR02996 family)
MTFRDDGFFHALQQDPQDDPLRLIYADFLEEYGDTAAAARAELIRVQVELAALSPLSRRVAELSARQDELLARWERVWLGDRADMLDGWAFRRGLVEAVRADASVFLDNAADWFAEWPTLTVAKLTRAGGHLPELAASPSAAGLVDLGLCQTGTGNVEVTALAHSQHLANLRSLDLRGHHCTGIGVAADSPSRGGSAARSDRPGRRDSPRRASQPRRRRFTEASS